ncbi:single-stranded DNA-binding protein [Pseudarthrobacter sp. BIM B-2242]|uniref:single-stranded DNA-binding protein n=1 Tax=Pseudarthrobacter sp. BIM B-2242 TaxID=2772401 RepID=UPI00168B65CF|nr:single-stranded DNA-binding protein [Pseudarthrobacter sp. BIM B-2242]QOD05888.1 single-stranded DNA-binding protein [Pseudarthrobacter sp. BIM B-2242]
MPSNIPFIGNLAHDIKDELQTETKSGLPRLNFRIGVTTGERGSDNEQTNFYGFTAFGSTAENMVKSFKKGDRLIVLARTDTYQKEVVINDKEVKLTIPSFKASNVGPDLTWASAEVVKNPRGNGGGNGGSETVAKKAPAKTAPAKSAPAASAPDDDEDF